MEREVTISYPCSLIAEWEEHRAAMGRLKTGHEEKFLYSEHTAHKL